MRMGGVERVECGNSPMGVAGVNKIAMDDIQPWEQPFWRPARGKAAVWFFLLLIRILAVVGLILFPLPAIRMLGLTLLLTALGGFGTTIGYHRMLAHRTLKVNKIIEPMLIFWAMFNYETEQVPLPSIGPLISSIFSRPGRAPYPHQSSCPRHRPAHKCIWPVDLQEGLET
jgi:hypothetical protein